MKQGVVQGAAARIRLYQKDGARLTLTEETWIREKDEKTKRDAMRWMVMQSSMMPLLCWKMQRMSGGMIVGLAKPQIPNALENWKRSWGGSWRLTVVSVPFPPRGPLIVDRS